MNTLSVIAASVLTVYFGGLFITHISKPSLSSSRALELTLQVNPNTLNLSKFAHLNELYKISLALEEYKRINFIYPLSKNEGKDWSMKLSPDGNIEENWISGIVPDYINRLPSNQNISYQQQYKYRSDGINYKLIMSSPDDCEAMKNLYKKLIDTSDGICNYGFWTYKER